MCGARIKTKSSAQIDLPTIRRSTIGVGQKTAVSSKKDEWESRGETVQIVAQIMVQRNANAQCISNGREKPGDIR